MCIRDSAYGAEGNCRRNTSPAPLAFAITPEVTDGGATEKIARIVPFSLIGTANRALRSGSRSALPEVEIETSIV